MTDRSSDLTRSPGPRIWLEGEKYHVREVPDLYRPHPEGLPGIARNCLLIGYPGVGKTMILKRLCADLAKDDAVFPLYVQIEPWAAKVSGEITYPIERRQTPWDRQLLTCFRILPSLGIIDRVHKYGHAEVVKAGTDLFPHRPASSSEVALWINEQVDVIRRVLEQGDSLPREYEGFPSLFEVANAIGTVVRDQDKTLVLLVDQVDKTSAAHFGAVASLLRRGQFVVVVATRPCPGAPEATAMPSAVVPGNDYGIHWVGCDARSDAWRRFISEVVRDQRFNRNVSDVVLRHLQPLTSLVGPSVRTLISLYLDLERRVTQGINPNRAWNEVLTVLMEGSEGVAAELLAAWCTTPTRVIKLLRERAVKGRQEQRKRPVQPP